MLPRPGGPVLKLKTPSFTHNALAWSPFFEDRLAVGSGTNFGLIGNGRLHVLHLGPGGLTQQKSFDTQDCVFDIAWNESHENQVVTACGNGSIKLFDVTLDNFPVKAWHEHQGEIMSVEWSNLEKDTFLTASWDQTVKVWNINRATSQITIPAHQGQIFKASFSPNVPSLLATCASDGHLNLFDTRSRDPSRPLSSLRVSDGDVLDLDWNKYMMGTLATASKDGVVRVWDTRGTGARQVGELRGHRLAARKVAWSPHHRDVLASTSYDMTCRTWSINDRRERSVHDQHTEFVMGTAWALFDPGLLGTCAALTKFKGAIAIICRSTVKPIGCPFFTVHNHGPSTGMPSTTTNIIKNALTVQPFIFETSTEDDPVLRPGLEPKYYPQFDSEFLTNKSWLDDPTASVAWETKSSDERMTAKKEAFNRLKGVAETGLADDETWQSFDAARQDSMEAALDWLEEHLKALTVSLSDEGKIKAPVWIAPTGQRSSVPGDGYFLAQ